MKLTLSSIALLASTIGLEPQGSLAANTSTGGPLSRVSAAEKHRSRHPDFERALQLRLLQDEEGGEAHNARSLASDDCESELSRYALSLLNQMSAQDASALFVDALADKIAFVHKIVIDKSEDDEYFGENGEYTDELLSRMDDIERFYGLGTTTSTTEEQPSILLGAHGSAIAIRSVRVRFCELIRSSPRFDCDGYADEVNRIINRIPGRYSNPLLTMNAFVANSDFARDFNDIDSSSIKTTIAFGDGILTYMESTGHASDHDPDFVLAHEYGHVLQIENGMYKIRSDGTISSSLRSRLELMADAFAAYYMAHNRGGALPTDEIDEISTRAATMGDFLDGPESVHGTPGQRECAAIWGANFAKSKAQALTSVEDFETAFDQVYADVELGKSEVCPNLKAIVACDESSDDDSSSFDSRRVVLSVSLIVGAVGTALSFFSFL
mmetsp:Transcript_20829/g.57913  ORF Transcript_20829/g.57913 Transcript_20829/m.57913 type:complete len:440 (-) Transcript_20829:610-1929(-)|eukprot:CAMPEP_0198118822 /NCGR_PEP_ID=MMETSP1442-20131203/23198_1 /TAXON_ID= /ORGANISM="Craspedostauros australis, Strain CCMP3328" /LENGTH=439 /DNA_ID=CAMNT_0043777147 /DNA_START=38 /DNA_END=1357 /DNA_ORIENTATION=+